VANGWKPASPSNTPIFVPLLFNGLIIFGMLVFMLGVVGWIAAVVDRIVARMVGWKSRGNRPDIKQGCC
jgi:hypothetical protein